MTMAPTSASMMRAKALLCTLLLLVCVCFCSETSQQCTYASSRPHPTPAHTLDTFMVAHVFNSFVLVAYSVHACAQARTRRPSTARAQTHCQACTACHCPCRHAGHRPWHLPAQLISDTATGTATGTSNCHCRPLPTLTNHQPSVCLTQRGTRV